MATEKIFTNIRLGLKVDTLANWQSSNLILKKGEVAFATIAASAGTGLTEPVVMMKIGDGEHTFSELTFDFYAKSSDVLASCKSETSLKAFVNGVIADAGIASSSAMEALAGRVTTAEGKITGLENELNTAETGLKARMTTAEGAIDALEGLVGEKNVATQIQEAIAALKLGDTYEVKGEAAKVQTALNEYKTSNDAAVQKNATDIAGEIARAKAAEEANAGAISAIKDGTTIDSFKDVEEALAGKEAAGAAAAAQSAAEAHADALNTAMDTRMQAVEAKKHEHANKAELDLIASGDKAKWDAMEQNAKDYTDDQIEAWVGDKAVGLQITEAINGLDLANTYEPKGEAAKVQSALNTHVSEAAAAYETKTDAAAKLTEAKGYTDTEVAKVQGEVDDLEAYVGTIPEGYTESSVIAYINKKAEETLASASGNSTETAASVKAALDTYKTENNAAVKANADAIDAIEADYLKAADKAELQGAIDDLEELVGGETVSKQISDVTDPLAARVKTIEDDYLKAADKTALQEQITTNANAIERLTNGVSADEVDGVNDLINYVKEHGTEVTGMKKDISDNAAAIDAIEADYLKAADKNELSGLIGGLDTRMGAAETAIGTKAAQSDLEALTGRVSTVEGKVSTLEGEMDSAEGRLDALEAKHAEGTVAEQIAAVTNPMSERIEALEAIDHEHANKSVLDGIEAADVTAWDAKVDAVTAAADSGLKATRTGNSVAIEIDDSVVFVFDCGDSSNV